MRLGVAGRLPHVFLSSKLTPLLIAAALGLGALAFVATPREEEPQIRVPMIDVAVAWPGADPAEVERRLLDPLEKSMWGLSAVEHVYGSARPGLAFATVRRPAPDCRHPECRTHCGVVSPPLEGQQEGSRNGRHLEGPARDTP